MCEADGELAVQPLCGLEAGATRSGAGALTDVVQLADCERCAATGGMAEDFTVERAGGAAQRGADVGLVGGSG